MLGSSISFPSYEKKKNRFLKDVQKSFCNGGTLLIFWVGALLWLAMYLYSRLFCWPAKNCQPHVKHWSDSTKQCRAWKHWPVHAEGAQVQNGDAYRGFLQEGHQLTQTEANNAVVKRPAWRQELVEKEHTVPDTQKLRRMKSHFFKQRMLKMYPML